MTHNLLGLEHEGDGAWWFHSDICFRFYKPLILIETLQAFNLNKNRGLGFFFGGGGRFVFFFPSIKISPEVFTTPKSQARGYQTENGGEWVSHSNGHAATLIHVLRGAQPSPAMLCVPCMGYMQSPCMAQGATQPPHQCSAQFTVQYNILPLSPPILIMQCPALLVCNATPPPTLQHPAQLLCNATPPLILQRPAQLVCNATPPHQ